METIYAPNTIDHIFSGKAIARATRAHILVNAALNGLLLSHLLSIPLLEELTETPGSSTPIDPLYESLKKAYQQMMNGENIEQTDLNCINKIQESLAACKAALSKSRTAKLWLQYMEMVDLLQRFIKAERTGNWPMKLETTQDMCEFLAAAGRNSYTKSLLLHLQQMTKLEIKHPEVYHHFMNGYHSIWRSDRKWAGLSPDYVIESVLMRSLKTSGGLTRGRGMSEPQRAIWTLSMPACASINSSMQELTGIPRATGEQHQELSQSRMSRDWKDICFDSISEGSKSI